MQTGTLVSTNRCAIMEDDMKRTADQMVALFGADAVPRLCEQAEMAEGIGDRFSAEIWLEIAEAIENP